MDQTDIKWAPGDDANYESLWQAVNTKDLLALKQHCPKVDLNRLFRRDNDLEGSTVLHVAASSGSVEVVRILLQHGSRVDMLDENIYDVNTTPIFYAARRGKVEVVRELLNAGADISVNGPNSQTVLSAVCWNPRPLFQEHLDTISLLISHGMEIDVRVPDNVDPDNVGDGPTALEQAIESRQLDLVMHILTFSPDLSTALFTAAMTETTTAIFSLLLAHKAPTPSALALYTLAASGRLDLARLLTSLTSLRPNANALCAAIYNSQLAMLEFLLPLNRSAISQRNRNRSTPLHALAEAIAGTTPGTKVDQRLWLQVWQGIVCREDVNVNVHDREGRTALHVLAMAKCGNEKCPGVIKAMECLLDASANTEIKDRQGKRAEDVAEEVARELLEERWVQAAVGEGLL